MIQMSLLCCKSKVPLKIHDLLLKGKQKVDEELDIVSMIKKIRYLDVIM